MSKKWGQAEARMFQAKLLDWYEVNKRGLPWRENPTPYRIWISEVMLQQTQAAAVLPYYRRFLTRFPDLESLASASERDILSLWTGLGYYDRARNLLRAAKQIAADHRGELPDRREALEKLPGIGRYTAGAICSIAFNKPEPVVDGNVRRVISRIWGLRRSATEAFFWEQAAKWIPKDRPSDFNQAVMELGALACVPSRPLCRSCPVQAFCIARKQGIENIIPSGCSRRPPIEVRLVILVLEWRGAVLLARRHTARYLPGEWGLPTCTLRKRESPERAATRLAGKLLCEAIPVQARGTVRHGVTYRRIYAHVFDGSLEGCARSIATLASRSANLKWIDPLELNRCATSSVFRKALCSAGLTRREHQERDKEDAGLT